MTFPVKSVIGFSFSIPASSLLFFWPGLISIMMWADYGVLPESGHTAHQNQLYYDFMFVAFAAKSVWFVLLLVSVSLSILYSFYLEAEARPSSLGDWQPVLLHVFFIGFFGFLTWVTLGLMSLAAWGH